MTGHLHPTTILIDKIVQHFRPLGFEVYSGPEIVTTRDSFDALNMPADHPARAGFDTFYLKDKPDMILRPHTTAGHLKEVINRKPPYRLLIPGRNFRNETTDATHNHTFYQVDALVIDTQTNLANLINDLEELFKNIISRDLDFRIRGSYFPFTEPSIELDMRRGSGNWLEMLGSGMVNPNVIRAFGLDPDVYQGYAFGLGIERVLAIKCEMDDIRPLLGGDYRMLGQFKEIKQ